MSKLNLVSAAEFNIEYYLNDDLEFIITVSKDGVPVDLSGKTLVMQVKKSAKSNDSVIEFSTAAGTIVVSGASNNTLTFTGTFTGIAGTYVHDLENQTDKETILYGIFRVTQDVTR